MSPLKSCPFVDQLKIDHGPRDLIVRFFVEAVQRVEAIGLQLSFGTFSDLNRINHANRSSWRPLLSTFQPKVGSVAEPEGFVFLGRNNSGQVVATQALRVFDWRSTNFKAEAESLRLLYADPETSRAPGETCSVQCANAHLVTGRVAMSGAGWYRPDYRGRKLGHFFPRMSRVYALASHNVDGAFAMFSRENVEKRLPIRAGFHDVETGIVMRKSRSSPDRDLEMSLGRQSAGDIVDDALRCLVDGLPQIDTFVAKRSA